MGGVYLITRHRQWRAWQFGRRHSRMSSNRGNGGHDDGGEGLNFNGFLKLSWFGRTLFVVLAIGFGWLCYARLGFFAPFAWFAPVMFVDGVIDMELPDEDEDLPGEEDSSQSMEERKQRVIILGVLTVLSIAALVSPEIGTSVFVLLMLLLFLGWVFR